MSLRWIRESPAHWDDDKARIVGGEPPGSLPVGPHASGDLIPGDWWRVEDGGAVVGYGWLDPTWGDAEVLLAVAPEARGRGIGAFVLDHLEEEARTQGLNYLFNVVSEKHPRREAVTAWLVAHGFKASHEDNLLRRPVRQKR